MHLSAPEIVFRGARLAEAEFVDRRWQAACLRFLRPPPQIVFRGAGLRLS